MNLSHDVALVEAMLKLVKTPRGQRYYTAKYSGKFSSSLAGAIQAFQRDHETAAVPADPGSASSRFGSARTLRGPDPGLGAFVPASAIPRLFSSNTLAVDPPRRTSLGVQPLALKDTFGTIRPGGPTMNALNDLLPAAYKDIRTAAGVPLVYVAGPEEDAKTWAQKVRGNLDLKPEFREKIGTLIDEMFERYEIVLRCFKGSPVRTFQDQYEKKRSGVSRAGPGESHHNYGGAMDIGYLSLQWMHPVSSSLVTEADDIDLKHLDTVNDAWMKKMWDLRNAIAHVELGLFPTSFDNDAEHLQFFSDAAVNMRVSLAALLNTAGQMEWRSVAHSQYECNLGFGHTMHNVGTSMQIWEKNGPMEKAWIAAGRHVSAAAVPDSEVAAMRTALKKDFQAAEAARPQWTPQR